MHVSSGLLVERRQRHVHAGHVSGARAGILPRDAALPVGLFVSDVNMQRGKYSRRHDFHSEFDTAL